MTMRKYNFGIEGHTDGKASLEFDTQAERDEAAEMVEAMRWLRKQDSISLEGFIEGESPGYWWEFCNGECTYGEGGILWQAILAAKRQAESEGDDGQR